MLYPPVGNLRASSAGVCLVPGHSTVLPDMVPVFPDRVPFLTDMVPILSDTAPVHSDVVPVLPDVGAYGGLTCDRLGSFLKTG